MEAGNDNDGESSFSSCSDNTALLIANKPTKSDNEDQPIDSDDSDLLTAKLNHHFHGSLTPPIVAARKAKAARRKSEKQEAEKKAAEEEKNSSKKDVSSMLKDLCSSISKKSKSNDKKLKASPAKVKLNTPKAKKKKRIPTGLSLREYTPRRGDKPRCQGCFRKIEYHEDCIRNKESTSRIVGGVPFTPDTHQYHCWPSCLMAMNTRDLHKFMTKKWQEKVVIETGKNSESTTRVMQAMSDFIIDILTI